MSVPWAVWPMAFVSASLLAFEVGLFRILRVMSWHHFAFLVISVALLGFGASGTALALLRTWVLPRSRSVFLALAAGLAVAIPIGTGLATGMPLEARLVPGLVGPQLLKWGLAWALFFVPFLLGAAALGIALMERGDRAGSLYAANLVGGAAGSMAMLGAMELLPPAWLVTVPCALAFAALATVRVRSRWPVVTGAAALVLLWFALSPPRIVMDPYKSGAHVERLLEQRSARRLDVAYSARGQVEIYASPTFHQVPFLGVGETPPSVHGVLIDGHWAGSQLDVRSAEEAAVMDQSLMAIPYELAAATERVLLLGEVGGGNVWLAARHRATEIHVVQSMREVFDLGGPVFDLPPVIRHHAEPRGFVDGLHAANRPGDRGGLASRVAGAPSSGFDVIELVTLEGTAAGTGGVGGLAEDHLITVEGIRRSIEQLAPDGILFACRGIQIPPRDNLKIAATMIEALRSRGIAQPEAHLAMVRDYLGVCTMVRASPWSEADIGRLRQACLRRSLTPVWFSGVRPAELNRPDALPGPAGSSGDWIHHGVSELLFGDREAFYRAWHFKIRPATDDSPFFADFFKLRSVRVLRELFGDLWLTRTELAFLFVLGAMLLVGAVGLVLTVLPLLFRRAIRQCPGKGATTAYFLCIGLGYLMIEIVALSRTTRLVGDSVTAAAVVIPCFLLFSGLGSWRAQRSWLQRDSAVRAAIGILLLVTCTGELVFDSIARVTGGSSLAVRSVSAAILVAPAAFVMGLPMPAGLARLHASAPALIPWAWGINGFASVLASPLATAIGMTQGFRLAGAIALGCYVVAALTGSRLPHRIPTGGHLR